ncbi:MAG: nuclear transport factor 2 family protein [Dehalococcoidia bacterium]
MTTQAGTQVEQDVLAAQRARFDATIAKDRAALERLMAADLTYVHTSAKLESREENIAAVVGSGAYKSFALAELQVRVEGDTAVITGTADITFARPDGDTLLPIRFTDVWARRDGAWREIAWQSTRRPEA